MKKTSFVLILAGLALAALGLWLWRVMPDQAWAVWDGERYTLVGEGWEVLYRGWPLALAGLIVGGVIILAVLAWLIEKADQTEHQAEIERLTGERDQALAARDAARAQAEADLTEDRAEAERLRIEALRARDHAHQMQIEARREVEGAQEQARNALRASNQAAQRAKNAIMAGKRRAGEIPPSYRAKRTKSVP